MPVPQLLLLLRLPAHVINGVGVALGVALIQTFVGVLGGPAAGLVASSGAIYASLADLPNTPGRTWRRVLAAALVGCAGSVVVSLLTPYPVVLGFALALIAFASAMALAWGPRAGPLSFVGILAFVFSMAAPPAAGLAPLLLHAGWTVLGATLYLAWAVGVTVALQPRYRTLALAATLAATAQLLRSRAALLAEPPGQTNGTPPLQGWIRNEAALDERLQAARDLLFAAPESAQAQRQTALLLLAIDMRDTLLAHELDLDLLGHDDAATRVRSALAANLNASADALDGMQEVLRLSKVPQPAGESDRALPELEAAGLFPARDPRAALNPVLLARARHISEDLVQMQALMHGGGAQPSLSRDELQLFVSPEGWPLAALRQHARPSSPVLRHALRYAVALCSAYFIGRALPWASYPYWLVLSVAVVLRGNLEQTLSRRNDRIAGTLFGCVLVLGLAQLAVTWLSRAAFIISVGVAHSYVMRRYVATAAAGTVMALLQAHLTHPLGGFAVPERLADTVLGALLAWGFSFVLPSWERRGLSRIAARVTQSLAALACQVLRWPEGPASDAASRLARREVYDTLGSVAATAQRTGAEPQRVRVSLSALATVLTQSHALLAHLAAVKLVLTRRAAELDRQETEIALRAAAEDVQWRLGSAHLPDPDPRPHEEDDQPALPAQPPEYALMPWLRRRLRMASLAAARVAQAVHALQKAVDV